MPRLMRLFLGSLILFPLGACGDGSSSGGNQDPAEDPGANTGGGLHELKSPLLRESSFEASSEDFSSLVRGNTAFAEAIYQELDAVSPGKNLFYSPISISLALGMTLAGAGEEARDEMKAALHLDLPEETLHSTFNALEYHVNHLGRSPLLEASLPFELRLVNAVWGQYDAPFLPSFLDVLALNYGTGILGLDFLNEPEAARQTINQWVEDKTEERIKDLLPEGSIDPNTALVLTNAIYFKASWLKSFNEGFTEELPFHLANGEEVLTPLMKQVDTFLYAEGEGVRLVALPFDGGDVSMVIVLPEELSALEENLDLLALQGLLKDGVYRYVRLQMPSFEYEYEAGLVDVLKNLGMSLPFVGGLTEMIENAELSITDVFHKAFIKVDEDGAEAAAATAVVVGETSVQEPQEPLDFILDKPFLYFIQDNERESILFVGRLMDPRP